jgi:ABC-2 type transport system ATP-binding protein
MSQVRPPSLSAHPAPGEPIVVCQQLSKVFKDFWMRDRARAVNNLTFDIRAREIFGLLGPNGSGKSTTIKMILGLLRPTGGRVAIFGKNPSDVAIKNRIGYLPEESYLYGFLNARETLEYYGKLFQLDYRVRQRRVDELLDMLGLTGAQFRPVREYSKGMQRRIGIAQALINDPDLLILDEPTTGLDPIGTRQIKDLIIQLGRRGKTVLLSSHLLADVEDCVDRLIILYGGQKRAEGTCDELLTSQSRTTLETEALDDETVTEVDRVIRARSAGSQGLIRVSKPRQSLEELFLDIVERAKSEVATSGATHGGVTASFLAAPAVAGEALIDTLVAAADQPSPMSPQADQPAATPAAQAAPGVTAGESKSQTGPDASVLGDLLAPAQDSAPPAPPQAPAPKPAPGAPRGPQPRGPADADDSIISSLLADDEAPRREDGPARDKEPDR